MQLKRAVAVGASLVMVIFAAFVWPTLYRYDHSASSLVRINRLTGKSWEYLSPGAWIAADGSIDGIASPDPNIVDTGLPMAPSPMPMPLDTSAGPFDDIFVDSNKIKFQAATEPASSTDKGSMASVWLFTIAAFAIVWSATFLISRWLFRRSKNLTASVQRLTFIVAAIGVLGSVPDIQADEPVSYRVGRLIGGILGLLVPVILAASLERRRRREAA